MISAGTGVAVSDVCSLSCPLRLLSDILSISSNTASFLGCVSLPSHPAACSHTFRCLDDHSFSFPISSIFHFISGFKWLLNLVRTRVIESQLKILRLTGNSLLILLKTICSSSFPTVVPQPGVRVPALLQLSPLAHPDSSSQLLRPLLLPFRLSLSQMAVGQILPVTASFSYFLA